MRPPAIVVPLHIEPPPPDDEVPSLYDLVASPPRYPPPSPGLSIGSPGSNSLDPSSAFFPQGRRQVGSEKEYSDSQSSDTSRQPFDFKPTPYLVGLPPQSPGKPEFSRRRGHKYARSSVSHQIILSPTPRTPLQLPTSLPVPTLKEYRASMTKDQTHRWLWCFCHLAIAAYVQTHAHTSLAMTTLSHLLFFDALGAFICVAVDVSRNFEVWQRSSISHPFGLERSEVLAGLATSIILLFMGLDLLSHGLTHALEHSSGHQPHHTHPTYETDQSPTRLGTVSVPALAALLGTLVSAFMLGNHARIGLAVRMSLLFLPSPLLRNSSHLLPVSLSLLLLLLPLLGLPVATGAGLDAAITFGYALAMVALGVRNCVALGRMLLMSCPGEEGGGDVVAVIGELEADAAVSAVEDARVWQAHYGLCLANFTLRLKQTDQVERVRELVATLSRNRLGGAYREGSKGVRWEISTQITFDK